MGAIGRELLRRSRERIIQIERHIDWMKSRGGFADELAAAERDLRREREYLRDRAQLDGPEN